ncbi:polyprenyl synthetase family protein [Actinomadura scrupuli]|uniref:polyprenyl synthetase family protein n=1 Tax=Actinomadura scrupuli TaxID=559629 RepID=UPI003D987A0A
MALFSFGWAEPDGSPRNAREAPRGGTRGGKGLRPALAVLCAEGAGGSAADAVPGAVAVELVHAFSLVHDDIMDGDEWRRHRQTVWKAYGVGPAVLAGDALLALGMDTLVHAPPDHAGAAVRRFSAALVELVRGQSEDVAFEDRPWTGSRAVTVEEYCAMAAGKTGALLACAAAVGALLGGGPPALAEQMMRLGRHLGLAYQAVDDLLGIWGDPEVTGKPVFNDLRRGKKSLPVVAALAQGADPALLAARPQDEETLRRSAQVIEAAGGRTFARRYAEGQLDQAMTIIGTAGLTGPAARELGVLARSFVDRVR